MRCQLLDLIRLTKMPQSPANRIPQTHRSIIDMIGLTSCLPQSWLSESDSNQPQSDDLGLDSCTWSIDHFSLTL